MRYRVEIYDANKMNDVTIPSEVSLNRESLNNVVKKHLNKFQGNVIAYVYDTKQKRKTIAMYFPKEIHNLI
jgi:hypothetical protein